MKYVIGTLAICLCLTGYALACETHTVEATCATTHATTHATTVHVPLRCGQIRRAHRRAARAARVHAATCSAPRASRAHAATCSAPRVQVQVQVAAPCCN